MLKALAFIVFREAIQEMVRGRHPYPNRKSVTFRHTGLRCCSIADGSIDGQWAEV